MRRTQAFLVAVLLVTAACQTRPQTPATHLANARSVYTAAVRTMTALAQADQISLAVATEFESVRVRTAAAIEAADKAVAAGFEPNFSDLTGSIESLMHLIQIAQAVAGVSSGNR